MPWKALSDVLSGKHGADRPLLSRILSVLGLGTTGDRPPAYRSAAFTAAVVALSAKLSKSDGVALAIEEDAFRQVFDIAEPEMENIRRLFALAKQDVAGFEAYAAQAARMLEGEDDLKHDIFDGLLHVASADGVLHEAEDRYLSSVAELFGYSQSQYRALRSRFILDADDPYQILGVAHTASNAELKAHYRRLVKENHPDTMRSHGVPPEFIKIAERKLAGINAAWDIVAKERGL